MWQAGMLLNSENANMTLERPLYLLTLDEKMEQEMEKLICFLGVGAGSWSPRSRAV